ncbi:MAG TPA: tetratricopeptide repeat protein [Opitutaceae bacterium]
MTTPAAPSPKNAEISPSPEERLLRAWKTYGSLIYVACGVIAIGILARYGWIYLNEQKELGIQKEFSEATTPDALSNFAARHPGHPLSGVAEATVADDAFGAGKYSDAVRSYSAAVADLPAGPVQSHAKLGLAASLQMSGKLAEAESAMRQILNDSSQLKAIRCEAGFHLAGILVAAGRGAEVQKLAEQLMQIDASSPFAARTLSIRPPAAAPVVAPAITS